MERSGKSSACFSHICFSFSLLRVDTLWLCAIEYLRGRQVAGSFNTELAVLAGLVMPRRPSACLPAGLAGPQQPLPPAAAAVPVVALRGLQPLPGPLLLLPLLLAALACAAAV